MVHNDVGPDGERAATVSEQIGLKTGGMNMLKKMVARLKRKSTWVVIGLLTLTATAVAAWPMMGKAATLQCRDLPGILHVFERQHYSVRRIDDTIEKHAVQQFIKMLDPSKTMLLQAEVQALENNLPAVFQGMRKGDCSVLANAVSLVIDRAEEDEQLVRTFLGPDYRLDENAELIVDPDARTYAKTEAERGDRVRAMVHFQISNYLLAGVELGQAKTKLIHRYELATKRLKQRENKGHIPEWFAESVATALDPHSSFLSADMLADFQIQMRLSLEGIGAVLSSQDGITEIESLVPGGQAERSQQLRPKDKIVAVAQAGDEAVPTIDMELEDVVKMIRGKRGTQVRLTILRDGQPPKRFEVVIVRDKIDISSQAANIRYETVKEGDKSYKIGVLELPSFYGGEVEDGGRSSYVDVKRLLHEANAAGVNGLVLDLSKNGGGLLDEAVRIAGLFIKKGAVVAARDGAGQVDILRDDDDSLVYAGPMVVLISRASASASEILAGALKDYQRAVVVGSDRTFGKGTVQLLVPLPRELGAVKITTAMFFLPGGASTQRVGVTSDIRIPSPLDGYDVGEGTLDYALAAQTIRNFTSATANGAPASTKGARGYFSPVTAAWVGSSAERSRLRVAADPGFVKVREAALDMEKRKKVVRLAELRKDAKANGATGTPEDPKEDSYKELDAVVQKEAVRVAVDWVQAQ